MANSIFAVVLVVSTIAGEVGGLIGYSIGFRWGRELAERPGRHHDSRERMLARGERAYARWGRLAVFFTPAIISGTARMKYGQFIVWNLVASFAFSLSVGRQRLRHRTDRHRSPLRPRHRPPRHRPGHRHIHRHPDEEEAPGRTIPSGSHILIRTEGRPPAGLEGLVGPGPVCHPPARVARAWGAATGPDHRKE